MKDTKLPLNRRFAIAPMMDWTDRHYRYLARLITKQALLYTEMITCGAILYGDRTRFLDFSPEEHPLAVQLGGSNPEELAECARLCESWGFDEINLNAGCPSDRVQNNRIGACLMADKVAVAECLQAMRESVSIPVTIKHRIGIDDFDSEKFLFEFVGYLLEAGTTTFLVHARIAKLKGLSPKQNREIPPLDYPRVYRLKEYFPQAEIIINGGIATIKDCHEHLNYVDGVMLGRVAYQKPCMLADVDHQLFGAAATRFNAPDIGYQFLDYIKRHYQQGVPVWHMVRHSLGLFHGQQGGKIFRRFLSQHAVDKNVSPDVFADALDLLATIQSGRHSTSHEYAP
jgi:tRNA-dihydrouridine synthase A